MKRVFILSSHPLFGKGIENLLGREDQVDIVGHVSDVDEAIAKIRALQPDVVIVDSSDSEANRGKIMMQVMKEGLKTRVVGLDLQDNRAFICQGEQRTIQDLGDFLGMITAKNAAVIRDRRGRALTYLRVAVTDRCNLRCIYCMPPEGVSSKPREAILHSEEIARMVEAAARMGFSAIRLTGGEPLVRKNLVGLVRRLVGISGIDQVTMTTNGTLLADNAQALADAGLKRVNVSLDTLQPERFRRITRMGELDSVWQGIAAAEQAGLTPLKINMVVIRGVNDDEVADMARLTLDHPWHVRFIEVMPIAGLPDWGPGMPTANERFISVAEIKQKLEPLGELTPDAGPGGHGPARYYRLPNARGTIGLISPISEHFCAACNRMRLTADGYLRPCLFSDEGVYVKSTLDRGVGLGDLQSLIRQASEMKPDERPPLADNPIRGTAMSMIGG